MQENLPTKDKQWQTVDDEQILSTCCAYGLKNQVKNHQSLVKAFRQFEKILKKLNDRN
jgi:hypothetical protein